MTPPTRPAVCAVVLVILLVLTLLTTALAYVPMGAWNPVSALLIAAVKAAWIGVFYMHLRRSSGLVLLFVANGVAMLLLLVGLVFADVAARLG